MNPKSLHIEDRNALEYFITEDIYLIPESSGPAAFDYSGENNKYLLILTNGAISPALHEFLMKILSAVQFEWRDIAIMDASSYKDLSLKTLKNFFSCTRLIAFGISPSAISIRSAIPLYQSQQMEGISLLFAKDLKEIEKDTEQKKQLWVAMKTLFN